MSNKIQGRSKATINFCNDAPAMGSMIFKTKFAEII